MRLFTKPVGGPWCLGTRHKDRLAGRRSSESAGDRSLGWQQRSSKRQLCIGGSGRGWDPNTDAHCWVRANSAELSESGAGPGVAAHQSRCPQTASPSHHPPSAPVDTGAATNVLQLGSESCSPDTTLSLSFSFPAREGAGSTAQMCHPKGLSYSSPGEVRRGWMGCWAQGGDLGLAWPMGLEALVEAGMSEGQGHSSVAGVGGSCRGVMGAQKVQHCCWSLLAPQPQRPGHQSCWGRILSFDGHQVAPLSCSMVLWGFFVLCLESVGTLVFCRAPSLRPWPLLQATPQGDILVQPRGWPGPLGDGVRMAR